MSSVAALLGRDASVRTRETFLTMLAVLLSFSSAYLLRRAEDLSASAEVLAVSLAFSLSRARARPEHHRFRAGSLIVLPAVALGASEIGTLLFTHPNVGDPLFVLAVASTVWVRRFSDRVRRMATFAVLPLIAVLIVPGVAVPFPPVGADRAAVAGLRVQIRGLRGANAKSELPDGDAWGALVNGLEALGPVLPSSSAP